MKGTEYRAWFNNCTKGSINRGNQWVLVTAGVGFVVAAKLGVTPGMQAAAASAGLAAAGVGLLGLLGGALIADPPDSNYTVIAEPVPPSFPPVTATGRLSVELADAANAWLTNLADAIGLARALITSGERFQGAAAAGDAFWQRKQLEAVAVYSTEFASRLRAHLTFSGAFQNAWVGAGLPTVAITPDDVRAFQADVSANGLPSSVSQDLSQLGLDGAVQEQIKSLLLAVEPDRVAGEFPGKLIDPGFVSAIEEMADDLEAVARAGCGNCDDGDSCTNDSCDGADGCVHTLPGLNGVVCALSATPPPAVCADVPKGVAKRIAMARKLAQKAISKPKKAKALLGKVSNILSKTTTAVEKARHKHKHKLSDGCAEALLTVIRNVRDGIATLQTP